jgi:hypothetical protein
VAQAIKPPAKGSTGFEQAAIDVTVRTRNFMCCREAFDGKIGWVMEQDNLDVPLYEIEQFLGPTELIPGEDDEGE